MVICLEQGAEAYGPADAMLLTVSCSSKIQTGFTFLVPAHPGSPGQGAVKWVCVCVCVSLLHSTTNTLYICALRGQTSTSFSVDTVRWVIWPIQMLCLGM